MYLENFGGTSQKYHPVQQNHTEDLELTLGPSKASLSKRVQESGVTRELSGGGLESADQTRVGKTGFSREEATLGQLCRDLARSSRSSFLPSLSAKARMTSWGVRYQLCH